MVKRIFIGGAWPYGNYLMHVGHLAALLPGDVIARYYRQKGEKVLYVSGTDCHGTPITERARKEKVEPSIIAHRYHDKDVQDFTDLGFTYDNYGATFMEWHEVGVKKMFKQIYDNGYFYEKISEQVFCTKCNRFLSDREIGGKCPICNKETKGDQCEYCLSTFNPRELIEKHCLICGEKTVLKQNHEMVFALSKFQTNIEKYFANNHTGWRTNAINETQKYLKQGLPDRDATRSIKWGVPVPIPGFEDKCVYVWIEALLGYLTSGKRAAEKYGWDFEKFIDDDSSLVSYYVHGKDNIPFHTVIFPALLMALKDNKQLPKRIISSEYVNMGNEKMSKSSGAIVTIRELLSKFEADSIRYYFIANNPEKRDSSYNEDELIVQHNKFLVGGFGNFVNRNLSFLVKRFKGNVPSGVISQEIRDYTISMYKIMGNKIAVGELNNAVDTMLSYIQIANKYYDEQKPWLQVKEKNIENFNNTTATCLYIIANMSNLFAPVLPFGCEKIRKMLNMTNDYSWQEIYAPKNLKLAEIKVIYSKI